MKYPTTTPLQNPFIARFYDTDPLWLGIYETVVCTFFKRTLKKQPWNFVPKKVFGLLGDGQVAILIKAINKATSYYTDIHYVYLAQQVDHYDCNSIIPVAINFLLVESNPGSNSCELPLNFHLTLLFSPFKRRTRHKSWGIPRWIRCFRFTPRWLW